MKKFRILQVPPVRFGLVLGLINGFVVGVVLAMVYNFAARWTGGIEFVVDDKA